MYLESDFETFNKRLYNYGCLCIMFDRKGSSANKSEKWIERLFKILRLVHETLVRFRIIAFNIYFGPPLILQVQFGHANSCANSDAETAAAKNKVSSCYFYSLIYPSRDTKWSNTVKQYSSAFADDSFYCVDHLVFVGLI